MLMFQSSYLCGGKKLIFQMDNIKQFDKKGDNEKPVELPNSKNIKANESWIYLLAAIAGFISIILPTLFLPDLKQYDAPLFPIVRTGIEGISKWSFGLLFLSGFGVKLSSKLSSWKIGLMTMALFPVTSIFEIFVDASSHNMLPFEFIFYAVYSFPAIIGAYLAEVIKRKF